MTLAAALGDPPASNKMAYGPWKVNISKNLKEVGVWSFDHSVLYSQVGYFSDQLSDHFQELSF